MILQRIAVIILTVISFNSCCGSGANSMEKDDSSQYRKIAEAKFGGSGNYKVIFNSDSTFLIASSISIKTTRDLNSPLKFFIYNLTENEIIFEENLPNGNIEWINDHQIKVTTEPGIVKGKEGENERLSGYSYDVILKRKIYSEDKIQKQ